jgi:hypothetical protein
MNKIAEEIIKKDINKFMPSVSLRISVYGSVLSDVLFVLANYINSNLKYKSDLLFWLSVGF